MTIAKIKDQIAGLQRKLEREAPPEPDPRDERIERLEGELAEERENAAGLLRNIDELHFKIEILEKSYSKQLEDARQQAEKAENESTEHKARLAELDGGSQETAKSLGELREELERVTAERDRLRRTVEPSPAAPGESGVRKSDEPAPQAESMSIDEILEDSVWAREQERIDKERGVAHGHEPADQDGTIEELIPPDAVFAGKDRPDDS